MPRRYAARRPRRRNPTRTRRRVYTRRRRPYPGRTMPGFPTTRVVKMRYVTNIEINPGIAQLASHQFRANSIFDPDVTLIGHQPLGYDQWSQFYQNYTVIGSKINAKFVYDGTNSNSSQMLGIYLTADPNNTPSQGTDIAEQGLGRYKLAPAVNYASFRGGPPQLTNFYSPKKMFNLTDLKDNQDKIGGEFGTNPTEVAYYVVWAQAMDGSVDLAATRILVTIDYTVLMSEPKPLAQS